MANFTDIFIRRPVLAIVIALFILLVGIVSYFSLPLREYPRLKASVVNIGVSYPGASPNVMESYVTTPIENAVGSGIDGVDYIVSKSGEGFSGISIHFKLGYDVDAAMADITSKVSSVHGKLPKDIYDPVIAKRDPDAYAMMYFGIQSKTMSSEEMSDYILRIIEPKLQTIDGVSDVQTEGEKSYAMRLWLDPYAMAAHNITAKDIYDAIKAEQVQTAAGAVRNMWQTMPINAITSLDTVAQFENLVVRSDDGRLIKLSDVGRVELGVKYLDVATIIDRMTGIIVGIVPKPDSNFLDISNSVKQAMAQLAKYFPPSLKATLLLDSANYIHAAIFEIQKTLVFAIVFVMLIIFLFLGSFRVLFIPTVAIPLSLIGVFAVMLMLGYSLNTLTFLALVLAVGMVVDDAIVVVENIYRHLCLGKEPREAALIGAREIQFAIISITLTLAAVYAPIGFSSGLTKVLFKEFAFTLAAAVIISGFIALTLSPLMCAKVMTPHVLSGRFSKYTHNLLARISERYVNVLEKALKQKIIMVTFLLLSIGACAFIYHILPKELAPKEDVGWIWTGFDAPAAANFEFTQKNARKLDAILESVPEGEHHGMVIGGDEVNSGGAFLQLVPWEKRKRSAEQIIQDLEKQYKNIPGLSIASFIPHSLPGAGSFAPIHLAIQSTGSYEELNAVMQKLQAAIKKNPRITNVESDLKIDQPQLDVVIDRSKAGVLGVSVQDISDTLNLAFGEPEAATFTMNGYKYDFIPELDAQYKNRFDALNNLQVRTASGVLVPLSNLVTLKESVRPRTFLHFQRMRAARLTASILSGYTVGEALRYVENVAKKIMPSDMKIDYLGSTRQFVETSGNMMVTFLFAVIFIFLVLAVQFESFRDPLIVMFTVPFSILGALLILLLAKGTISIYSQIGLITLVGLITKHGILVVTFANQERKNGAMVYEAIIQAAKNRLRPILMTTCAVILGALPLALTTGAGSISRRQIGLVIIGGMLIGTLFTLFVIPVMYTLLAGRGQKTEDGRQKTEDRGRRTEDR